MDGINKVHILGNLGSDPELKMTPGGRAVLKLSVATNESWTDKDNVRQDRTEWHRITVFGKQAENLAKFVRKGWKVFVEGRIEHSSYEKDGQKHYATDIIALRTHALSPPRSVAEGASNEASAPRSASNGAFPSARAPASVEIPF